MEFKLTHASKSGSRALPSKARPQFFFPPGKKEASGSDFAREGKKELKTELAIGKKGFASLAKRPQPNSEDSKTEKSVFVETGLGTSRHFFDGNFLRRILFLAFD